MAGRNGLFYDRKGQDWDATITKLIANPISLRQANWNTGLFLQNTKMRSGFLKKNR